MIFSYRRCMWEYKELKFFRFLQALMVDPSKNDGYDHSLEPFKCGWFAYAWVGDSCQTQCIRPYSEVSSIIMIVISLSTRVNRHLFHQCI